MKARTIALIGIGVLGVGAGALYLLKKKGIVTIGENFNPGGIKFLTADEVKPITEKRTGNVPIQIIMDSKTYLAEQSQLIKDRFGEIFPEAF